jgi:glycosyltransferase involved in cell wall biosynthesis
LRKNKQHIEQIVQTGEEIIFSSEDSLTDFRRFFPSAGNKTHVLRFAVGLPEVKEISKADVLGRFPVRDSYFITPNTFWAHKNHQVLIRAMKRCVDNNADFDLVLTGKQSTYHEDGYFQEIRGLVEQHGLNSRVHFLGLIDRAEQVALLRHATAIIQPSKFEGWSTVVEEAKALNRPLIVSDIPIHREQVLHGLFFTADDDFSLASAMTQVSKGAGVLELSRPYSLEVSAFGSAILDCLKS